jgi:1-phosphatidylinositol-3-phosphate 5-kinase
MTEHHRTYVHDDARVTIFVEPIPQYVQKSSNDIAMWIYCKVCKRDSPVIPMSDSTWKYSFGKYLELLFGSKGLQHHDASGCPHDYYRDHIRCFQFRDIRIRICYDPIDLLEIIVPRARIMWKVENDLRLKNETFTRIEERWYKFITSIKSRLKSIRIDSILPEKGDACIAELDRLEKRAQEDQLDLLHRLQDTYVYSKYYEVIPFNAVVREMLERAGEWDQEFSNFEAAFMPDKDLRRLTVMQLKKIFNYNESKESIPSTEGTTSTVETCEPPTQAFTESEDKTSTQLTEYTISSLVNTHANLARSSTSTKSAKTQSGMDEERLDAQEESGVERVAPLDLASPSSSEALKNPLAPPEKSRETSTTSSIIEQPLSPKSPFMSPTQLLAELPAWPSQTLPEKLERLRRENQTFANDNAGPLDPPRPIPERDSSHRAEPNISPPMVRALPQPVRDLPTAQSGIAKPFVREDGKVVPSDADSTGGSVTKVDKNLSERLVLKLGRKPRPSSIPRFVHQKIESKVSTLARHFKQLTREFEKERIPDHKQRAAKMNQPSAFLPQTTTEAIVEVYDNVDEAVQDLGPPENHFQIKDDGDTASKEKQAATEPVIAEPVTSAMSTEPQTPTESTSPADERNASVETDDKTTVNTSVAGIKDEGAASEVEPSILNELLPGVEEIANSLGPSTEIPLELPKHQKKSLMNILTTLWTERSLIDWPPLEYPFNPTDHIFIDSNVIVREDEPSSLIAFTLGSEDYQAKLLEIHQQWQVAIPRDSDTDVASAGAEPKSYGTSDPSDFVVDEAELEKSLLRATGTHLKYKFIEGSATMICKIFYIEQFDALRRKCGVSERIVETLSRCLKWDPKGGKTNSVFLKTLDNRLVLKVSFYLIRYRKSPTNQETQSLSPIETSAFLRFAPAYFSIMAQSLFHGLPSVIAKMLGFFQIIIKNSVNNTDIQLDLLVMENLFYDRSPTHIFDLKGSMRNRKVQPTGEPNEVLLDENMVEYMYESPLFAREHAKNILRDSLWNDTLFLAQQNVMDYSLMVAVDGARKELVVGIIDCIRTYTWDKKLESWVKDRGFVGGGRSRPTVTSPKKYKSRFREAMERYILGAPHR